MKKFHPKLLRQIILIAVIPLLGFTCVRRPTPEVVEATKPLTLKIWGVFDNEENFTEIINDYRKIHPNVSIEYRKFRFEEYEQELLNALAEDRGPDIFMIHNTWMRKYLTKIIPFPSEITLPFTEIRGRVKPEQVTELKKRSGLSIRSLQNAFVEAVPKDVVIASPEDGVSRIYGLPFYLDTLSLFYNKDLLARAAIPLPPTTWSEFQSQVKKLVRFDAQGNIIQAGAALGTSNNVERFADILTLLMMQNGTEMTDEAGFATFERIPPGIERNVPPGEEAVIFYTDFANPAKEVYTWNEQMPNSLEAFINGSTSFIFGYSYHIPQIRARAPKLNFGVTKVPQIGTPNPEVNFANYWIAVVSKKTKYQDWAWDFLEFATVNSEENLKYLNSTRRPAALKALIQAQLEDIDLAPFAEQVLTAKSWYRGKNTAAMETALARLINAYLEGKIELREAMRIAVNEVNQTIR